MSTDQADARAGGASQAGTTGDPQPGWRAGAPRQAIT
jgi:hypothetical protein